MSPRKSSTSSGKPRRTRVRYLGLEVAGGQPVPLSPADWIRLLQVRSGGAPAGIPFRIVRAEGFRAIARVERGDAPEARRRWNGVDPATPDAALTTVRTWGTLVGAKAWLGAAPPGLPSPRRPRSRTFRPRATASSPPSC